MRDAELIRQRGAQSAPARRFTASRAPRVRRRRCAPRSSAGRSREGWTAAGVDEFLRAYLTPPGRAAFYAAARQIYLEEPHGSSGFWTRLGELSPEALFVWGRRDRLVPIAFKRHVSDALPTARHVVLDCGHVPQVERPEQTHAAVGRFLAEADGAKRRTRLVGAASA